MKGFLDLSPGFQATIRQEAMSGLGPCLEHVCVFSCVLKTFLLVHCAPGKAALSTFALHAEHVRCSMPMQP